MNSPNPPINLPAKRGPKLDNRQRQIIVNSLAQGMTATQVLDEIREKHGIIVTPDAIHYLKHAPKWKAMYQKRREEYFSDLGSLDASNKYVRVKRLDDLTERAIKKGDLKAAISATTEIRKEFEKDNGGDVNIFWNNPVYQQFNKLSNEELVKRHEEATRKLKELHYGPGGPPEENKV